LGMVLGGIMFVIVELTKLQYNVLF